MLRGRARQAHLSIEAGNGSGFLLKNLNRLSCLDVSLPFMSAPFGEARNLEIWMQMHTSTQNKTKGMTVSPLLKWQMRQRPFNWHMRTALFFTNQILETTAPVLAWNAWQGRLPFCLPWFLTSYQHPAGEASTPLHRVRTEQQSWGPGSHNIKKHTVTN